MAGQESWWQGDWCRAIISPVAPNALTAGHSFWVTLHAATRPRGNTTGTSFYNTKLKLKSC